MICQLFFSSENRYKSFIFMCLLVSTRLWAQIPIHRGRKSTRCKHHFQVLVNRSRHNKPKTLSFGLEKKTQPFEIFATTLGFLSFLSAVWLGVKIFETGFDISIQIIYSIHFEGGLVVKELIFSSCVFDSKLVSLVFFLFNSFCVTKTVSSDLFLIWRWEITK